MEVEIGQERRARVTYGFDDIAIVPSRRTRDPEDIEIDWDVAGFHFDLPVLASAMDGAVDARLAIEMGKLGGLAVLNLEGIQTRYKDPAPVFKRIAAFEKEEVTPGLQEIYREPIKPKLITERVKEIKKSGVVAAASLTPQKVEEYHRYAIDAGLDVLIIQGTVVSAEHVSTRVEPLNLNEFITGIDAPVIVGGCASYATALHLMRTGAIGVLVGVGPGAACTTRQVLGVGVPQATAICDAAAARTRYLEETGKYIQVIADGGMRYGGDVARAIACGADAVMIGSPIARAAEAPGLGHHWGMATFHADLPRGTRVKAGEQVPLSEILVGPSHRSDGTTNLFGALRTSMATCGYKNIKEFHKAELIIAPAVKTEGKGLQQAQKPI